MAKTQSRRDRDKKPLRPIDRRDYFRAKRPQIFPEDEIGIEEQDMGNPAAGLHPAIKALYDEAGRTNREALVLSAKTTLRERWKQVSQEKTNCDLYLATVNENIAANAIKDMDLQGIVLVVPESLKNSDITEYKKPKSAISLESYFNTEIGNVRWPLWVKRGLTPTAKH
jgi:hypothetical protein